MQETIEIAVELIFENNPQLKVTKRELKQLFNFATSGTHFIFNGSFYDQIDGVSMGSPLGPVLANLIMGYNEKKWLQEFDKGKILMYKLYIDDIFCMFGNEKDAENFFEFLNCQQKVKNLLLKKKAIKFCHFLIFLSKMKEISLFQHQFIGLFTKFNSFTPISYKIGLVRGLMYRAFKISSSYIIFHNELEKVKILLQKNIYPKSVIDNQIKTFLDKPFTVDSGTTSEKQKTLHYSLPYIRHFSHVTKKKLKHICERFCKDIDICIAFSPLKLSSFSSCKDILPKSLHSYAANQFTCAGCKACYIGETKRHLNTRIEEHLGNDKKSHIYSHLQENPQCQERVNFDCFEIIDRASSYFRLQIKEKMHINWKKPELNKQVKHVGISISI